MRIDQLFIQNFKGFEKREFSFNPQFNFVVGDNETGKTALLEAIDIALGALFLGFDEIKSPGILKEHIRVVRHQVGKSPVTEERQFPVSIHAIGECQRIPCEWSRLLHSFEGRTTQQDAYEIKSISAALQKRVRDSEPVDLPMVGFYGTGRLWIDKRERQKSAARKRRTRFGGYVDALEPTISKRLLVEWFKTNQAIALQSGFDSSPISVVQSALARCHSSWAEVVYDFQYDELVAIREDKTALPFSALSDGVRSMLAMVADIARRMLLLNPHLGVNALRETQGIVLVDEIDMHLHPKWQQRVCDDLREIFPAIQFVVTTHSPFITQTAREGELLNLDDPTRVSVQGRSIEEISEETLGAELTTKSNYVQEKEKAAKDYLEGLEKLRRATSQVEKHDIEAELARIVSKYSEDQAFSAVLALEKAIRVGPENETG